MARLDAEQYRALVEHIPTMVWRAAVDTEREYVNANWTSFTGRSLEQELGRGWLEGVHPDDLESCSACYVEHFARRQPFETEFRLRRYDGVYRYVYDRGVPYEANGSFGGFIGCCADIDERRAREVSSGETDFFGMSLDNLCVAGFDGYLKHVNLSWTRTLGWTPQELMSRPSLDFVHPDDRAATLAGRERLHAEAWLGPLVNRYLCKDGSYRWFEWRSVGHRERGLVYAAARDVTEQKLAEASLAEAQELQEKLQAQLIFADRLASVGTLAAGVAHELNNPLAYVTANIALIIEELASPRAKILSGQLSELEEMARQALTGAERIRKIVLGLKTFSRTEEERRTAIDLPIGIGTGLGLSICHNIVFGMGGEIALASVEGRGTTVRVVLPAARSLPVGAVICLPGSQPPTAGAAVLVVDDEPAIGTVLRRILRDHEVTVVTRAKHALELISQGKHFDVIVSDLMMPDMSGMGFYDELRKSFPEVVARVVFISGDAFTPTAKAFFDRVPNEVIAKPFGPHRVRQTVERLSETRKAFYDGTLQK